ncbi:MAG: nucleotidyltransferase family protein [Hyphomicrobiales bacterium]|nr:nucleotidyltransferase family protein [Hyphomicrobiales bacterium]MDG1524439.1 nucleotidyltransferase family protein [Hyphomicrobiales bacterium]MDG2413433.1 nucleotidyltransferase family protein [Hyphomicrobiales bacterium]
MEQPLNKVACFILAAGMSKRMGSENKLLKKYKNKIIINQTLKNHSESKLEKLNIIIGHDKESLKDTLKNFQIGVIENDNYMSGMLSSIKRINDYIDNEVTGIMISLADMPLVSSKDINSILDTFLLHDEKKICIPEFNGRLGNPIIIPLEIYKKIIQNENLLKDKGLKSTILDGKFDIVRARSSSGVLKDFDTQKDFN